MKLLFVMLVCLFTASFARAEGISAQDEKMAAKEILRNIALDKVIKEKDQSIRNSFKLNLRVNADITWAEPGECPGPGHENGCWDACTNQGFGASYCVSQCGVATSSASGACWDACTKQGFGSSYCAPLCGTSTSGGSASCWNSCSAQGFGSSYCKGVCGVSTEGGQNACWAACSKEGFGVSYCASECGKQ